MKELPNSQLRTQHLHWRAGFGERYTVIQADAPKSLKSVIKRLFKESEVYTPFQLVNANPLNQHMLADLKKEHPDQFKDELKMLKQESKEQIKTLNIAWLDRMAQGKEALRQKMTLFWHGHFACRSQNAFFAQQYLNTLQEHALGKFGDLLIAVSKTPAMLQFLNNQQNKKGSPNENFAREVMELFTLGRGNYTEQDVKEAARAFTGWSYTQEGEFHFRENQHDTDLKLFLGKTGYWSGNDILRIILEKKETAIFVCRKIYRYFVNDQVDEQRVGLMAERFYKSDYDIRNLLEYLFNADWFYEPANIGTRIKSPLELITGLTKGLQITYENPESLLLVQKLLGQVALYPPNVAGWADGKNWIDSSSLLFRMQLPESLFHASEIARESKHDGDADNEHLHQHKDRNIRATIDLSALCQYPQAPSPEDLLRQLAAYWLQVPLADEAKKAILSRMPATSGLPEMVNHLTLQLLTLPEYQLC